jgi:hypothetical protein
MAYTYAFKKDLTAATVRERLNYDQRTGQFTWRKTNRRGWVGMRAGKISKFGYVVIKIEGKFWYAHRLAWLHHYGEHPRHTIDHLNFDKADNRIANLRDVPAMENWLRKKRGTKRGCITTTRHNTFKVEISRAGRLHYVGTFKSKPAADQALAAFITSIGG